MHRITSTLRPYGRHARPTYFPSRWLACSWQCRSFTTPPILKQTDDVTNVTVKSGINGYIPLTYISLITSFLDLQANACPRIRLAPRPEVANPVIIYLKRGMPTYQSDSLANIHRLATSANATVVFVDYRLTKAIPYPVPIHDVGAPRTSL